MTWNQFEKLQLKKHYRSGIDKQTKIIIDGRRVELIWLKSDLPLFWLYCTREIWGAIEIYGFFKSKLKLYKRLWFRYFLSNPPPPAFIFIAD